MDQSSWIGKKAELYPSVSDLCYFADFFTHFKGPISCIKDTRGKGFAMPTVCKKVNFLGECDMIIWNTL